MSDEERAIHRSSTSDICSLTSDNWHLTSVLRLALICDSFLINRRARKDRVNYRISELVNWPSIRPRLELALSTSKG